MKTPFLFLLTLLLSLGACYAQEDDGASLQLYGDIGSYHALRTSSPYNWMTSRNRFRLAGRYHFGDIRFFGALKVNHHGFIKQYTGIFPHEFYMDYTTTHFGFRAGKQIVIRGVADGLRLNDIVAPMDMTEFLTQEYDDIRMAVNAVRLFYFSEFVTVEAMLVPTFQGYKLPLEPNNPWSVVPKEQLPVTVERGNEPDFLLKNMEYGGHLSFNLPGIDFSLSGLYTWNKLPCFRGELAPDFRSIILTPQYDRMTVLGADFSKPLDAFVVRGEFAYSFDKLYSAALITKPTVKKDLVQGLLGIDWYGPNSWNISAQGLYEYIPNYQKAEIATEEHTIYATLRLSKKLINDLLTLSSFGYFDIKNKAVFNRFSGSYQVLDGLLVNVGYDLFYGDKGMLGIYKNNSEVWVEAVYKF